MPCDFCSRPVVYIYYADNGNWVENLCQHHLEIYYPKIAKGEGVKKPNPSRNGSCEQIAVEFISLFELRQRTNEPNGLLVVPDEYAAKAQALWRRFNQAAQQASQRSEAPTDVSQPAAS